MNNSHSANKAEAAMEKVYQQHLDQSIGQTTAETDNDLKRIREMAISKLAEVEKKPKKKTSHFLRYGIPSALAACFIVTLQINGSLLPTTTPGTAVSSEIYSSQFYQETLGEVLLESVDEDDELALLLEEDDLFFEFMLSDEIYL